MLQRQGDQRDRDHNDNNDDYTDQQWTEYKEK